MRSYFIYLLQCSDGTLYTGWSHNVHQRLKQHNDGKGAKYTRARLPVILMHTEEYATKRDAMQREWAIKRLSRDEKWMLIKKI